MCLRFLLDNLNKRGKRENKLDLVGFLLLKCGVDVENFIVILFY